MTLITSIELADLIVKLEVAKLNPMGSDLSGNNNGLFKNSSHIASLFAFSSSANSFLVSSFSFSPVSYTHLDVYKRQNLLKCLETETPEETILDYVLSDKWTEARIKKFVSTQIRAPEVVAKLTDIITSELNKRTWSKSGLLTIWLKWLFTFRNTELNSMKNKHTKKNIKHLKSSLKTSSDTLPILLGIQGKLEMLKNQANLRKYLQELKIQDEEVNAEAEIIDEEQLIDGNGEESHSNSEIFVDATEF